MSLHKGAPNDNFYESSCAFHRNLQLTIFLVLKVIEHLHDICSQFSLQWPFPNGLPFQK
jgi:hypothetical protein